jgi:ribonuclease HII
MSTLVCGVDEVGRGALAGPILAVAAVFRFDELVGMNTPPIPGLADSKTFSSIKKREEVWKMIIASQYLVSFGIGEASVEEINQKGINWANMVIFQRAIMNLKVVPDMVYVDGENPVAGWPRDKQRVEPQADAKYWPVSAASILAKVTRDRMMGELDRLYNGYAWHSNMGYGSELHKQMLLRKGPTEYHRTQFIEKIMKKPVRVP